MLTAKPGVESVCLLPEASPDKVPGPRALAQSRQHAALRASLLGEQIVIRALWFNHCLLTILSPVPATKSLQLGSPNSNAG